MTRARRIMSHGPGTSLITSSPQLLRVSTEFLVVKIRFFPQVEATMHPYPPGGLADLGELNATTNRGAAVTQADGTDQLERQSDPYVAAHCRDLLRSDFREKYAGPLPGQRQVARETQG